MGFASWGVGGGASQNGGPPFWLAVLLKWTPKGNQLFWGTDSYLEKHPPRTKQDTHVCLIFFPLFPSEGPISGLGLEPQFPTYKPPGQTTNSGQGEKGRRPEEKVHTQLSRTSWAALEPQPQSALSNQYFFANKLGATKGISLFRGAYVHLQGVFLA